MKLTVEIPYLDASCQFEPISDRWDACTQMKCMLRQVQYWYSYLIMDNTIEYHNDACIVNNAQMLAAIQDCLSWEVLQDSEYATNIIAYLNDVGRRMSRYRLPRGRAHFTLHKEAGEMELHKVNNDDDYVTMLSLKLTVPALLDSKRFRAFCVDKTRDKQLREMFTQATSWYTALIAEDYARAGEAAMMTKHGSLLEALSRSRDISVLSDVTAYIAELNRLGSATCGETFELLSERLHVDRVL